MTDTNDRDAVDLLHLMGHLYLKSGQVQRALALLLIATRMAPNHAGVLHALCHGFLASGSPRRALNVIARLEARDADDPALTLLRSRAEWMNGDHALARQHFKAYLNQTHLDQTYLDQTYLEKQRLDDARLTNDRSDDHSQGAHSA